jgi:hypothetical protein
MCIGRTELSDIEICTSKANFKNIAESTHNYGITANRSCSTISFPLSPPMRSSPWFGSSSKVCSGPYVRLLRPRANPGLAFPVGAIPGRCCCQLPEFSNVNQSNHQLVEVHTYGLLRSYFELENSFANSSRVGLDNHGRSFAGVA